MKIVHVISFSNGFFSDILAMHQSLARRRSNTTVVDTELFFSHAGQHFLEDEDTFIVYWPGGDYQVHPIIEVVEHPRKAKIAMVWSEAYDRDKTKLLDTHRMAWDHFMLFANKLDAVFVHTPKMVDLMSAEIKTPVFLLPVGWDAEAMGSPRWHERRYGLAYWGTPVGRRVDIVPLLVERIPNFANFTGTFGRELLGALDASAMSLHVKHTDIDLFSGWKLWQIASTSCTIITEEGDTWPFVAGEHLISIPTITPDNIKETVDLLCDIDMHRATECARSAHELVRNGFTIDSIEDEHVIPAFCRLGGTR